MKEALHAGGGDSTHRHSGKEQQRTGFRGQRTRERNSVEGPRLSLTAPEFWGLPGSLGPAGVSAASSLTCTVFQALVWGLLV